VSVGEHAVIGLWWSLLTIVGLSNSPWTGPAAGRVCASAGQGVLVAVTSWRARPMHRSPRRVAGCGRSIVCWGRLACGRDIRCSRCRWTSGSSSMSSVGCCRPQLFRVVIWNWRDHAVELGGYRRNLRR
jgi:hypothetical protein